MLVGSSLWGLPLLPRLSVFSLILLATCFLCINVTYPFSNVFFIPQCSCEVVSTILPTFSPPARFLIPCNLGLASTALWRVFSCRWRVISFSISPGLFCTAGMNMPALRFPLLAFLLTPLSLLPLAPADSPLLLCLLSLSW